MSGCRAVPGNRCGPQSGRSVLWTLRDSSTPQSRRVLMGDRADGRGSTARPRPGRGDSPLGSVRGLICWRSRLPRSWRFCLGERCFAWKLTNPVDRACMFHQRFAGGRLQKRMFRVSRFIAYTAREDVGSGVRAGRGFSRESERCREGTKETLFRIVSCTRSARLRSTPDGLVTRVLCSGFRWLRGAICPAGKQPPELSIRRDGLIRTYDFPSVEHGSMTDRPRSPRGPLTQRPVHETSRASSDLDARVFLRGAWLALLAAAAAPPWLLSPECPPLALDAELSPSKCPLPASLPSCFPEFPTTLDMSAGSGDRRASGRLLVPAAHQLPQVLHVRRDLPVGLHLLEDLSPTLRLLHRGDLIQRERHCSSRRGAAAGLAIAERLGDLVVACGELVVGALGRARRGTC